MEKTYLSSDDQVEKTQQDAEAVSLIYALI